MVGGFVSIGGVPHCGRKGELIRIVCTGTTTCKDRRRGGAGQNSRNSLSPITLKKKTQKC